ncbi:unnamed protein product [Ectocarpus sp. CCAP 1310/34]|nr:unnamed protein product [Ectocarpus sp. CCAP 1310/34]
MNTQNTDVGRTFPRPNVEFLLCLDVWEGIQEIPRTEIAQSQEVYDSCSSPTIHDASAKQLSDA